MFFYSVLVILNTVVIVLKKVHFYQMSKRILFNLINLLRSKIVSFINVMLYSHNGNGIQYMFALDITRDQNIKLLKTLDREYISDRY